MIFDKIFFKALKIKWFLMKVVGTMGGVGTMGVVGVLEETRRGSEKTQSFFLNSFSHLAMISASGIVFKKPLANKKLKLS